MLESGQERTQSAGRMRGEDGVVLLFGPCAVPCCFENGLQMAPGRNWASEADNGLGNSRFSVLPAASSTHSAPTPPKRLWLPVYPLRHQEPGTLSH